MLRGERPRVVPVRRRPPAVEQTRGGEREGSRGDGREPRAPVVGGDERVDDGWRRVVAIGKTVAGDEDDVGPLQRVETVGDVVRQPVTTGHEAGRRAAHPYLVRHARARREHLRGDAHIERLRAFEHEDGGTVEAGGWHGPQGTRGPAAPTSGPGPSAWPGRWPLLSPRTGPSTPRRRRPSAAGPPTGSRDRPRSRGGRPRSGRRCRATPRGR